MICRKCGTTNKDGAPFCRWCNADLRPDKAASVPGKCQSCGEPVSPGSKFCGKCFAMRLDGLKVVHKPSKYEEAVAVKIAAREEQMSQISLAGPALVVVAGALFGLAVFLPGIIIIILGIVWAVKRSTDRKKLQSEIHELRYEHG